MRNGVADLDALDEEDEMGAQTGKLRQKTMDVARSAYKKVETEVLAVEGRRSLERKARVVANVTRKAVKAGIVAGAVVATAVVVRDIRKRRKLG
jgi:hypothetical protein